MVRFHEVLQKRKEYVISNQVLRCGTSIGANVREAINAQSDPDFLWKLSIAQKECDETLYRLELLKETEKISSQEFESIHKEATALLKIIRSIILTKKKNIKQM